MPPLHRPRPRRRPRARRPVASALSTAYSEGAAMSLMRYPGPSRPEAPAWDAEGDGGGAQSAALALVAVLDRMERERELAALRLYT